MWINEAITNFHAQQKRFIFVAWMFIAGLAIVGCGVSVPISPEPHPTIQKIQTTQPSKTPTGVAILTSTASITPTATFTWTPSATSLPSLTPLPTYSEHDSVIQIWRLLHTNGDCRLPCFWGIVPGQTTVYEFVQFVNQYPYNADLLEKNEGYYTFYYHAPIHTGQSSTVLFFNEGELIQGIGIQLETAHLSFPLNKLLKEYGVPDKVLIGPDPNSGMGYYMFVIYDKQRIAAEYHIYPQDEYLCYEPPHVSGIVTWAEGKNWLEYINQLFGPFTEQVSESSLKPLEHVTVYDLDAFHKQFSTKSRPICMKKLTTNP